MKAITTLVKFILASDAENITAVSFTKGLFVVFITVDCHERELTYSFEELIMATIDSQNNPCDSSQDVIAHLTKK
jgi:hypothetical protein